MKLAYYRIFFLFSFFLSSFRYRCEPRSLLARGWDLFCIASILDRPSKLPSKTFLPVCTMKRDLLLLQTLPREKNTLALLLLVTDEATRQNARCNSKSSPKNLVVTVLRLPYCSLLGYPMSDRINLKVHCVFSHWIKTWTSQDKTFNDSVLLINWFNPFSFIQHQCIVIM